MEWRKCTIFSGISAYFEAKWLFFLFFFTLLFKFTLRTSPEACTLSHFLVCFYSLSPTSRSTPKDCPSHFRSISTLLLVFHHYTTTWFRYLISKLHILWKFHLIPNQKHISEQRVHIDNGGSWRTKPSQPYTKVLVTLVSDGY